MAFTTNVFLFIGLPISVFIYYLISILKNNVDRANIIHRCRLDDVWLIIISSIFYSWSITSDLYRFWIYIIFVYLIGCLINYYKDFHTNYESRSIELQIGRQLILPIAIASILLILINFKYTEIIATLINWLLKTSFKGHTVAAPIGISFITFSAISYLVDIFRGKAKKGNLIDFALYMCFFPKVVSGPIVLWRDFALQIHGKGVTLDTISYGISRLIIGFGKKLILADTFGACIAKANGPIDIPTAFGVGLLYMLQIYYDFSGYSDIAIGLARMLGFSFKENFNFPYLSCSITEFWRRWHISLGSWFREYVYIPLGGSKNGESRTILNIAVVFLLTGIWHGAGWNYMIWGVVNGMCIIFEKLIKNKSIYISTPAIVKWLITMGITYWCWIFFRLENLDRIKDTLKIMLGRKTFNTIPYTWEYYFDNQLLALIVLAIMGATVFGLPSIQTRYQKMINSQCGFIFHQLICLFVFILAIVFMVNSKYSPFIYFQY